MLLRLLPLLFLPLLLPAQDVRRIEQYLPGTRVTYYMGQCGEEVPETAGRLSFCDGAGNLGVVTQSLGLSGRGVLRMLPNYFNDSEVYVTRGGISIRHTDGSWENVPNQAVPTRDFRDEVTNDGTIETGFVDPRGVLHLTAQNGSITRIYVNYDLLSKTIVEVPVDRLAGVDNLAYDADRDATYLITASGGNTTLYGRTGLGEVVALNDLNVIGQLRSALPYNTKLEARDDTLWISDNQGLYALSLTDYDVKVYDNTTTGRLPLDDVNDFVFADATTLWLAQSGQNRGAIVRYDLASDTYEEYVLIDPESRNDIEFKFSDLALLGDGRVTAVAPNLFGYIDLDVSGTEPQWTIVGRDSLAALGLTITYTPTSVERHAGRTYYLTNDFSTGNTDRPEVLIRDAGDRFVTRNDDRPTNYSYWELERFNHFLPDLAGGMYLLSSADHILTYIDQAHNLRSRTFVRLTDKAATVDQEGRLPYFATGDGTSTWRLFDQPVDRELAGIDNGGLITSAYGNVVSFFSRATGEYIRTINGRIIARDTLPGGGQEYSDVYHFRQRRRRPRLAGRAGSRTGHAHRQLRPRHRRYNPLLPRRKFWCPPPRTARPRWEYVLHRPAGPGVLRR